MKPAQATAALQEAHMEVAGTVHELHGLFAADSPAVQQEWLRYINKVRSGLFPLLLVPFTQHRAWYSSPHTLPSRWMTGWRTRCARPCGDPWRR